MRGRLGGDKTGRVTPFVKRLHHLAFTADYVNGDRPGLILSGDLNVRLVVAQDDYQGVIIQIALDKV